MQNYLCLVSVFDAVDDREEEMNALMLAGEKQVIHKWTKLKLGLVP